MSSSDAYAKANDPEEQKQPPRNIKFADPRYLARWRPKDFLPGPMLHSTTPAATNRGAAQLQRGESSSAAESAAFYRNMVGGDEKQQGSWTISSASRCTQEEEDERGYHRDDELEVPDVRPV